MNALNNAPARNRLADPSKPKLVGANIDAPGLIDARTDFINRGGNFTGILFTRRNYTEEAVTVSPNCLSIDFTRNGTDYAYQSAPLGRLPEQWAESLLSAFRRNGNLYVVYSYETPIAWTGTIPLSGAAGFVMPEFPATPTTDAHRRILTSALGVQPRPYE